MTKIIVDVGASTGIYCVDWAKNDPNCIVYAFEPLPESYSILSEKAKDIPNLHVFECGIDINNSDSVVFYEYGYKNSSSLLQVDKDDMMDWKCPKKMKPEDAFKKVGHHMIKTTRLDDFLQKHEVPHVDFLKIDTQGNDFDVIKSLGDRINSVKEILCEVQLKPLYAGACTKDDVVNYLGDKGFVLTKTESWSKGQEENLGFVNKDFREYESRIEMKISAVEITKDFRVRFQ